MDDMKLGVEHFNAGRFEEALLCFQGALARGERDPQLRCFTGHVLDSLGRPREAIAAFAAVIGDQPRHLPAYCGLANVMLRRGPLESAAQILSAALTLEPGDAAFRRRLVATLRLGAQAFQSAGDLETAEKTLRRVRALAPRDALSRRGLLEMLRLRVQSCLSEDRFEPAEKALREILLFEPADGESRRELIKLLLIAGKLEQAERALRAALSRDLRDKKYRSSLIKVLLMRSEVYLSAGGLAKAEKSLRRALALGPREPEPRRRLIKLLRMRGQDYQSAGRRREAEATALEILKVNPRDAWAHLSRGGIAFSSGRIRAGKVLLGAAVRLDRGELSPADRFKALMKLGRYQAAVAVAERILDAKPTLADIRVFWDPWQWDDRWPRAARIAELRKFERALGPEARGPWLHYYRADLSGPQGLPHFARLAAFPAERYGWMYFKAASAALLAGRYRTAAEWFELCLRHEPVDWRAHCFLAETNLCLNRPREAFDGMDRALKAAPANEAGQVLAWRGAFDLWLGRYEEALGRFEQACRLGAQCAFCWKGAALLKLGRKAEALAQLNLTLRRYPLDFEAYVWRGEAKRELGLHAAALKDLEHRALVDPKKEPPIWLWALFNRALVKRALKDDAGMKADFDLIPKPVVAYIRSKAGVSKPADILAAGLRLSRGFRRDEYSQAIWMTDGA